MQTFLPVPDFNECARILDPVRRWKQVVEGFQLVNIVGQGPKVLYHFAMRRPKWGPVPPKPPPGYEIKSTGYWSHPAAQQWRGRVEALMAYCNAMLATVVRLKTHDVKAYTPFVLPDVVRMPGWLGDERLHSSHRANLLRKDPGYYGRFGWTDDPSLPYFWPPPDQGVSLLE